MIKIKTDKEIELMKVAGAIVYETHQYLKEFINVGITTKELNDLAHKFIISKKAFPSFKNYGGFPRSICVSLNEEVVHGIPGKRKLISGDIVKIDIGACYKGYHGDSAWTYIVGNITKEEKNLLEVTKKSLYEGLKAVKPGNKVSDISAAIEKVAKENNIGIVKELIGHGIGKKLHESPEIPNYLTSHCKDATLKVGMTLAIEPMFTLGEPKIFMKEDGWTVATNDGLASAHYEHTVLVTNDGCIILTGE